MIFNFIVFIALVLAIVLVTRNMMITSIRKVAVYLRWNNKVVGQLLGYATSTPEFLNAFVAASIGMISTSIYNVISSNILNIVFVILATLIYKKRRALINKKFIIDYVVVLISVIIPIILMRFNVADKLTVIPIFLILYFSFLIISKKRDYFEEEEEEIDDEKKIILREEKKAKLKTRKLNKVRKQRVAISWGILFLSFILLFILGNMLSDILEILGNTFGVSELILGIVIGIATSLPELLSFMSSYHRHRRCKVPEKDRGAVEVVSNLVTSNISNLCIIQTFAIIVFWLCS